MLPLTLSLDAAQPRRIRMVILCSKIAAIGEDAGIISLCFPCKRLDFYFSPGKCRVPICAAWAVVQDLRWDEASYPPHSYFTAQTRKPNRSALFPPLPQKNISDMGPVWPLHLDGLLFVYVLGRQAWNSARRPLITFHDARNDSALPLCQSGRFSFPNTVMVYLMRSHFFECHFLKICVKVFSAGVTVVRRRRHGRCLRLYCIPKWSFWAVWTVIHG